MPKDGVRARPSGAFVSKGALGRDPISERLARAQRSPTSGQEALAPAVPRKPADAQLLRPQPALAAAVTGAEQMRRKPEGLGLDSAAVRERMTQRLRRLGIHSEPLLQAMAWVPRHRFVDSALAFQAYEDTSLPIGHGQTISKPIVVARMIDLLLAAPRSLNGHGQGSAALGRVLEIGTGCGYQAAVLARLATRVVSVERIRPLHEKARQNLNEVGARNIHLIWADGREEQGAYAPFDSIIAAAGGDSLPSTWLEQLADGGRLVAPMHSTDHGGQVLMVVDRQGDQWHSQVHDAVHFVPLEFGRT